MDFSGEQVTAIVLAILGLVSTLLQRRKTTAARQEGVAARAVAAVDKYLDGKQPADILEDEAVRIVARTLPALSEETVRGLIRDACRRRKVAAADAGIRGVKP